MQSIGVLRDGGQKAAYATFSHKGPVALLPFGAVDVEKGLRLHPLWGRDGSRRPWRASHAAIVAHRLMLKAMEASRTCPLALVIPT